MVLYIPMGPPLQLFCDAQSNTGPDGKEILSAAKMNVLHAASMNACDALDGAKDGVIADPRQCKFDPGTLACEGGGNADKCLTDAELTVARKFYEGPRNKKGLFPRVGGQLPGSEKGWVGFAGGKSGGRGMTGTMFSSERVTPVKGAWLLELELLELSLLELELELELVLGL